METETQLFLDFGVPAESLPQLWTPHDIFSKADDRVVRLFSEDRRVERKPPGVQPRLLGDYLSMYANTQPHGGVIFIGVENTGEISGCSSINTDGLNKYETVCNYCPDARHEFKRVPVKNRNGDPDFVVLIRVYYREDKLVETTDGDAFVRIGEEKRRLSEAEKREIRINKGETHYELEPVQINWPDDFDIVLADQLIASYIRKRTLSKGFSREDALCLLRLGKKKAGKFVPNLACALVLAQNPRDVIPGARIRISRYDGVEERFGKDLNQVFDTYVDGPIPSQIAEADKVISSQIRNYTRLGNDGKFYTRPEYPRDVWLEAVINACVHRSYNLKQMNIFVKMFDDKMVVESPGGFLPPTTGDTVYESHNPRNPYTMEALFYLEFVHCAYEGTRRMRDGMLEASLPPPEFAQKQIGTHQIHVTLKNNAEARKSYLVSNVADLIGGAIYEALSEREKMVLNFVAEHQEVSVSDAARLIGKDWRAGKTVLQGLEKKGLVHLRFRSGKERESSKRYVLKPRLLKQ